MLAKESLQKVIVNKPSFETAEGRVTKAEKQQSKGVIRKNSIEQQKQYQHDKKHSSLYQRMLNQQNMDSESEMSSFDDTKMSFFKQFLIKQLVEE